jgi:hypothetical protein
MSKYTIYTEYLFPPIPIRDFDWHAYWGEGTSEYQKSGYGRTELEAITNLMDTIEEDDLSK